MAAALAMLKSIIKEDKDLAVTKEAIQVWKKHNKAQESPAQKLAHWQSLYEDMPDSYPVAEQYILSLARTENFDLAEALCEDYPEASTTSIICTAVESYFGAIDHANALFDLAVSRGGGVSDDVIALITTIATALKEAGKYAQYERVLLSLEVLQPGNLWHQVRLGELFAQQGCYEKALKRFRNILFIAPESSYTADLLDSVYETLNLSEKHVAEWQALVKLNPGALIPMEHLQKAQQATSTAINN